MTKIEALIVGSIAAACSAMIIAKCAGAQNPIQIAGIYLFITSVGIATQLVRPRAYHKTIDWWWRQWTPRAVFMIPFVPFFLSPLFVSCALVASDWKKTEPFLRHASIAAGFVLAVPSFFLWNWLCGPSSKSNKSPEHNALSRE